jgi:hypothetical protein
LEGRLHSGLIEKIVLLVNLRGVVFEFYLDKWDPWSSGPEPAMNDDNMNEITFAVRAISMGVFVL